MFDELLMRPRDLRLSLPSIPVAQQQILELLSELTRTQQITLLVISRDSVVVQTIADQIIDMRMDR